MKIKKAEEIMCGLVPDASEEDIQEAVRVVGPGAARRMKDLRPPKPPSGFRGHIRKPHTRLVKSPDGSCHLAQVKGCLVKGR